MVRKVLFTIKARLINMNKKYFYISLSIVVVLMIGAIFLFQNESQTGAGREYSSADTAGLTPSKPTETVELKNGDTYDLTASYVEKDINGTKYRMLAYNGSIPGPLIKLSQGAEVTINFANNTDMKTLLHSHGVRMDNAFDGSQTSQEEMDRNIFLQTKISRCRNVLVSSTCSGRLSARTRAIW